MKYMTGWFAVSNNIQEDPKLMRCSLSARWAFICALAYCSRQRTDGEIIREALPLICYGLPETPEAIASDLVQHKVWTDIMENAKTTRYVVNNYLYWQPSREQIEATQAATAARQKRYKAKLKAEAAAKKSSQVVDLAAVRKRKTKP